MNLQGLKKVETPDFYIGLAFRRANESAGEAREELFGAKIDRSKTVELKKLEIVKKTLISLFSGILKSFPSFDQLPEFYKEMVRLSFDYTELKLALGSLNWCNKKVDELHRFYSGKIKKMQDITQINKTRNEFYGRIGSILRQLKKHLKYLEEARRILKEFPNIKTATFTVVLSGFPNVGKTTLLSKLSNSTPEIANYSFTTTNINIGYCEINHRKIQILDTPGSLARKDKMNAIEKQAELALKYCANIIVYVFDLTETSYPLSDQQKLYKKIHAYKKPVIVYISKTDLVDKKIVENFKKKALTIDELKEKISEIAGKELDSSIVL